MKDSIVIAVASGKGGTGKTTFSVPLAFSVSEDVHLLDCDVEEPNCHIFLKPTTVKTEQVHVLIPESNNTKCNKCEKCSKICRFNAIISLPLGPMIFQELCHSCGGCVRVCPTGAITEKKISVGTIDSSISENVHFFQGKLTIGHAISLPVIKAVKKHINPNGITIIDSPPGTSCPMIAAVKDTDFIILVTEPTPFGLNDLILAVETVKELKIPFGVLLNRYDSGDNRVDVYCKNNAIPILMRIPESRSIAESYSIGKTITEAMPELKKELKELLEHIIKQVKTNKGLL